MGFGNRRGEGVQVDLLLHSQNELSIVDSNVLWVLGFGDGDHPIGTPRYALFSSIQAKQAEMGSVARGKQNNLRINDFKNKLICWNQVSIMLQKFLQ